MSRHEPGGREREEREARFLAWDVPGDAHIVALVCEPADAERSATVVDAIATSVARRREHTLLLSAEPGPSPLDELLGGSDSEGLPAALGGRARLTDVAVQRADRPFVYLPAGHDPTAMAQLLENQMLASFVGRVRERGGTLFMVVSERTLSSAALRSMLDGYVTLGEAQVPLAAAALKAFGRVRFDEADGIALTDSGANGDGAPPGVDETPVASDPASVEAPDPLAGLDGPVEPAPAFQLEPVGSPGPDAERTSPDMPDPEAAALDESEAPTEGVAGSWDRYKAKPGFPVAPVAGGAIVVLLIAVGWWWLVRSTQQGADPPALTTVAQPEIVEPASPPPLDRAEARQAFESAPELPYSVQIASFAARADAEERIGRLRASSGVMYFVAPTPVRGIVDHCLFAGALGTEEAAQGLLADLVAAGEADDGGAWAIKTARLAFDLGMFRERAQADERVADLEAKGIPAYALAAPLTTDSAYQVYGGAFSSERASLPMAEMLDLAGEPASLIARRGVTLGSSTP